MAKIEEIWEKNDKYIRNNWNRQFRGLDKYGNAIHPRYRKNEKKL